MAQFWIRPPIAGLATRAALVLACTQSFAATPSLPATAPPPTQSPRETADALPLSLPPLPEPRPPREPAPIPASGASGGARNGPGPADDELACRSRLRALGVDFGERAPLGDPAGCALARPVVVRSLGRGMKMEPEAVLNCATAEAVARFVADIVAPAARSTFGLELVAVGHDSAYVCRPRRGTAKLSEHAFGNAIDLGSFALAGGRSVAVSAATDAREADFLSRIRMAACGPFRTVLGPGTDSDHARHFHFDLAARRNGGTYCR